MYCAEKLSSHGITEKLRSCLADFLHNRTQVISYSGAESTPAAVMSEVVQGLVVGSWLFIIIINIMPQQISSVQMVSYAYDGKAVCKAASREDYLQNQADLAAIYY